jgi:hypothetical protein
LTVKSFNFPNHLLKVSVLVISYFMIKCIPQETNCQELFLALCPGCGGGHATLG